MDVEYLQRELERFAVARDWNQFHSPKNLAMALAGEAGELVEVFQWMSEEDSYQLARDQAHAQWAAEELADVVIYALRLADKTGINLEEAIHDKMAKNAVKYPIELSKGNAQKYNRRQK